jgi:hypothetical protein
MLASAPTREKLTRLAGELGTEFTHVPAAEVEKTLFAVAEELLTHARFQDYVPLLAHRQARERLRSHAVSPRAIGVSLEDYPVAASTRAAAAGAAAARS